MIAIIVEFCVIIYLSSLTNLMDIIMKFVSMAAITRFDDMYAAALFENPMKKAAGQKLKFEFKRYMQSMPKPDGKELVSVNIQDDPEEG